MTMTPLQNLYYAIGEMAYAIAISDGEVQKAERLEVAGLLREELEKGSQGFDISGIIFNILDKQQASLEQACESAIREVKLNSHYLSPEMKDSFLSLIHRVAEAYPPVTIEERAMIDKFRNELAALHGDPVYYRQR